MDKILLTIANTITANMGNTTEIGLFNGKMGLAIFFYEYARYTGDCRYEKMADSLIDEVFANTKYLAITSVANGYGGIGIGLTYLLKKNLVSGSVSEIFHELDDCMLTDIRTIFFNDIKERHQMFSSGMYFVFRRMLPLANEEQYLNQILSFYKKLPLSTIYSRQYRIRLSLINSMLFVAYELLFKGEATPNSCIKDCVTKLIRIANDIYADKNCTPYEAYTYYTICEKLHLKLQEKPRPIRDINTIFEHSSVADELWIICLFSELAPIIDNIDVDKYVKERLQNFNYWIENINGELAILGLIMLNKKQ